MKRAAWHRRASTLVLFWLAASAIPPLAHWALPASGWLMVHVLLLGAATNAMLIWSQHFTRTLLRLPDAPDHRWETSRLVVANIGILLVIAGMTTGIVNLVVAGGGLVAMAALLHGISLARLTRKALPSRFGLTTRYYIASAVMLILAVGLGVSMAGGPTERLLLAHVTTALLGWLGLGILGTLVTLWPTMLHSRIADDAESVARKALVPLIGGIGVAAAGFLSGVRVVAVAGLVTYLLGAAWMMRPLIVEARRRPPRTFATWSTACGLVWLAVALLLFTVQVAMGSDRLFGPASAAAVIGVAQILLGSLSHLVPTVTGGGPLLLRVRLARVDRWMTARLIITNGGLALCLLPVPSAIRVTASSAVLAALIIDLWCLLSSVRVREAAEQVERSAHVVGGIVSGLGVLVLAIVAGIAFDPAAVSSSMASAGSTAANATATGQTTTVDVQVRGMRFLPDSVTVPAGNQLVVRLHNTGEDTHDLMLDSGQRTPRLRPGESATLDVGVVGRSAEGWCSVAGHRQMGMVFTVLVADGNAPAAPATVGPVMDMRQPDLMTTPEDFVARDARLPSAGRARVHRITLDVREVTTEIAPGVQRSRWTFGGTAPGPVLHGGIGDRFIITLVNDGSIGHSIDFHAGALAPDRPMRTIQPGESLTYRFTATRAGIWMYHCSTMPMSMHIANGMFGAVVIDPPGLPEVDKELVLVQSEGYAAAPDGTADAAAIAAQEAELMMFNGYAMQYRYDPLTISVGERVRVWVLDAGPNRNTSFHVVGAQFDTVYREGAYDLRPGRGGSQTLGLFPAQGGFVEFVLPEAGRYPFVSHIMSDAERGASGVFEASSRQRGG